MTRYFAYGSNMNSGQFGRRCPGAHLVCAVARLDGYELDFRRRSLIRNGGVADIVPRRGASVFGCVWEVPDAELEKLDHSEGIGIGAYRREAVIVRTDNGELTALTYTVVEKEPVAVSPTPDYARLILDGAREHGLPLEYQAQLRARLGQLGVAIPRSAGNEMN